MAENGLPETEEENFAELFAAESAPGAHLSSGQRVTVTVVAVTADTVFVSTGSKVDGIVERAELEEGGASCPEIGAQLDLYVVNVSPQEVRLSKMMRGAGGLAALEEARDARLPVEGKIQALVKGGFAVEVMKRRAFCPMGQLDIHPVPNPETLIGATFPFIITRLEKNGRNIVLSRRAILEAEQAANQEAFLGGVAVGDILEGEVARLASFGVFVELAPGVEGLVHLSELAWGRVANAEEAVSVGDKIRVKILDIAANEKGARISLSARQVMDDPWGHVSEQFTPGAIVTGKVSRNTAFGSFIELLPGIDGLVHISELSYEKRVNKPEEILTPGETVSVKIKDIDLEKKRISLSLRDAGGNPWEGVSEDFPIGAEVSGIIEKRATFGIFITLRPGVTGLLPASHLASARGKGEIAKANVGDAVSVVIREVNMDARKVTLGLAGEDFAEQGSARADDRGDGRGKARSKGRANSRDGARDDSDWKKHASGAAEQGGFGNSLNFALQRAALNKKK
ncbi:30S ribosomal protein S1 [Deltaproteobacteria bacterium]|nr:30S ribosomal protein S1 [Deltaproteobacteria bacterium]